MENLKNSWLKWVVVSFLMVVGIFVFHEETAYAATPITIKTVDYENETIVINNNGNSRIYFNNESDAGRNSWEVLNAEATPDNTTTIDFSWVSSSLETVLVLKGEENGTQVRVTLLPQTLKLDISINFLFMNDLKKSDVIAPLLNIMTTAGTGNKPIVFDDLEWRKGENGKWRDVSELTVAQLEMFQIKGVNLNFRIKAVNDVTVGTNYPDGLRGRRASRVTFLKITKKIAPVVIGIDGQKFRADIKYGKEYRVTIGGVTSGWVQVTDSSVKSLPLSKIVNNGKDGTDNTKAFPAMKLEIRNYSTTKTAASKITEIILDAQRTLSGQMIEGKAPANATAADNNIYISYYGSQYVSVTIPSASSQVPYEYCVVKQGETYSHDYAIWTSITRGAEIKILNNKAVDGSTLYIRQKEIKSKAATKTSAAVNYALASTYKTFSVSYPATPIFDQTTYVYTKGYSDSLVIPVKLNPVGKVPYETGINSIKLGTKDIAFTTTITPTITNPMNPAIQYTMTITLNKDSLQSMANTYNKSLTITFNNGTVDKTSVKLTVQNPTAAPALTATAQKGTATGTTAVTVVSSPGSGNKFVYTINDALVKDVVQQDKITTGQDFTSGSDVSITAGKYLTIYEINTTTSQIIKYKSIQITADKILYTRGDF